MFAHVPFRDWEAFDRDYPAEARKSGCLDIADQLIRFRGADVVLGGGLQKFRPEGKGGSRDDGRVPEVFLSDFFDFSVYVDAAETDVQEWYVERFLALRRTACGRVSRPATATSSPDARSDSLNASTPAISCAMSIVGSLQISSLP